MRVVWLSLIMAAMVVAAARSSSQAGESLQLQVRVLGEGAPVVLLGGGLLEADGAGRVSEVLSRTRRVFNVQSLAVQYGLEDWRPALTVTPFRGALRR